MTALHNGPAYQLLARTNQTPHGTVLQFVSVMPTARHPEEQIKFQTVLSKESLQKLQKVLSDAVATATI